MARVISSNAPDLVQRMMRRKAAVTRELSRAAVDIKHELVAESRRVLKDRIYSVEIPFSAKATAGQWSRFGGTSRQTAKKRSVRAWRRSGDLLRAENGRTRGPVVVLVNTMGYAAARNALGTPQGRPIRTPGVQSVQWQTEAVRNKRGAILERRRRAVLRALEGG